MRTKIPTLAKRGLGWGTRLGHAPPLGANAEILRRPLYPRAVVTPVTDCSVVAEENIVYYPIQLREDHQTDRRLYPNI